VRLKASYITPVPGGVWPVTVTMLLHNMIVAARRQLVFPELDLPATVANRNALKSGQSVSAVDAVLPHSVDSRPATKPCSGETNQEQMMKT